MTWSGFPLYFDKKLGWGYIVPDGRKFEDREDLVSNIIRVVERGGQVKFEKITKELKEEDESRLLEVSKLLDSKPFRNSEENDSHEEIWKRFCASKTVRESSKWGVCPYHNAEDSDYMLPVDGPHLGMDTFPQNCWFFRIPHVDRFGDNVGSPLSKGFARFATQPFMKGSSKPTLDTYWPRDRLNLVNLIEDAKMISYWENTIQRLLAQMVFSFKDESSYIIPRVIVCGTITRRAVERTWLTASNPNLKKIGSELKAIVQSGDGECFVGADVDSQEMWIATLFGDRMLSGVHGSTASSWMFLKGDKASGNDLHSSVAQAIGVKREHAKVLNYARIYGAGARFATQLLANFNPSLSREDCSKKIKLMYGMTKGVRRPGSNWEGGSESHMFNYLESIVTGRSPRTPALKSQISRALEPQNVGDDFMTSRINWVVQSSAVDYLHILLTNMSWLIHKYKIKARLALSIHDEVRYMADEADKYRVALALQISNLITRAFFCHELGMYDLPASVAFFSEVEIDHCLRKSCDDPCITPSNPLGMEANYGIPNGRKLNINELTEIIKSLEP